MHSRKTDTLHTTFYTLHFTHYTLHSTLHTLHCTLYTLPPPPGISIHLQPSPCGLLCLASLQLARPSNALSSVQFHHLQPQPRTSSPDISSHRQPLLCGLLCFPAEPRPNEPAPATRFYTLHSTLTLPALELQSVPCIFSTHSLFH